MNVKKMMKEIQRVQDQMQEQLATLRVEATAGGGAVTAVMDGRKNLVGLTISKEAVDPDDIEMLQDLVLAAVSEAARRVDEQTESAMGGMLGGLGIPGLR